MHGHYECMGIKNKRTEKDVETYRANAWALRINDLKRRWKNIEVMHGH